MKSYFRFLSRNKLYTTIEVFGMAIAIAFVVFIGSFVIREYNTDSEIKKQGNIYIGHSERLFFGCATIKEQLEGKFPEVEDMCRMMNTHIFGGLKMTFQAGNYTDRQKASIVDENFFRFFPFPLEAGTPESVLKEKNSVVISRTFANKVFGKEDPIGKSIKIDVNGNTANLNITGIFSDFKNTIFYSPEIIYRIDLVKDLDSSLVGNGNGSTVLFIKAAEGTGKKALSQSIISANAPEGRTFIVVDTFTEAGSSIQIYYTPLSVSNKAVQSSFYVSGISKMNLRKVVLSNLGLVVYRSKLLKES